MLVPFSARRAATALGLFLVVLLYCIPLATNLGGLEMENDEAGYSYQVDRMLETGDWMTPRAVPTDVDLCHVGGSAPLGRSTRPHRGRPTARRAYGA